MRGYVISAGNASKVDCKTNGVTWRSEYAATEQSVQRKFIPHAIPFHKSHKRIKEELPTVLNSKKNKSGVLASE